MIWLIYGIVAFMVVCLFTAAGIILAGSEDDLMTNDWWRDQ